MKNIKHFSSLIKPGQGGVKDFKTISHTANSLINQLNPQDEIKKQIRGNPQENPMDIRLVELARYKLSLFLNRELQQEILLGGDLSLNRINSEIASQRYSYSEDKTNNLFLHKRSENFFILVHFKYLKPNKDRKKIADWKNDLIREQYKRFGNTLGFQHKLIGADYNPDFKQSEKEDLIGQGVSEEAEHEMHQFKDRIPFYFNINLINKRSECMQYTCYSQHTKVHLFNWEHTRSFSFLDNLQGSKDDWDIMREEKGGDKSIKAVNTIKINQADLNSQDVYGPVFYTLSKPLQVEFINLLTSLGVTADVNNFIRYLGLNRERREFIKWNYKILDFLN